MKRKTARDEMELISNTTFVVKSFMRPACLDRLVQSILARYPKALILVADDGPDRLERDDVHVFNLPFDTGLSYGRNFLIDQVCTEYLILMDDDHVFKDETVIEHLVEPLVSGPFDLIGAQVVEAEGPFSWEGLMELNGTFLSMKPGNKGTVGGVQKVDFCHNFFAAKTKMIQQLRWNDDLKMGEHTDFFLRAKTMDVRVGYCPSVQVFHAPEKSAGYARYRKRAKEYRLVMMKHHGIRKIVNDVSPGGNLDLDENKR